MELLAFAIAIAITGLIVGALARRSTTGPGASQRPVAGFSGAPRR
jgi:hypothetical protein